MTGSSIGLCRLRNHLAWDRQIDGRIAALFNAPYCRVGHKNSYTDGIKRYKSHCYSIKRFADDKTRQQAGRQATKTARERETESQVERMSRE